MSEMIKELKRVLHSLSCLIDQNRRTILVGLSLALLSAGFVYFRNSMIGPVIYSYGNEIGKTTDIWFDGDIPKTTQIMIRRDANQHSITSEHPLMSLVIYSPTVIFRKLFGLDDLQAIRLTIAIFSFLWTALLFFLLRVIGSPLPDAVLFTLVGLSSAASMFWFAVPEGFPVGSLSIVFAIFLSSIPTPSKFIIFKYYLINLATFGIIATNWMAGILSTILHLRKWQAIQVITGSFGLASMIWFAQKLIFPAATNYFFSATERLSEFFYHVTFDRVWLVARSFFVHTMVMPQIQIYKRSSQWRMLTIQDSSLLSFEFFGYIAVFAWVLLLGLGLYVSLTNRRHHRIIQLAGLLLLGQLGMHILFGKETFLYSPHFLPMLVIIAAQVTASRFRKVGLALAAVFIISAFINNYSRFLFAVEFIRSIGEWVGIP